MHLLQQLRDGWKPQILPACPHTAEIVRLSADFPRCSTSAMSELTVLTLFIKYTLFLNWILVAQFTNPWHEIHKEKMLS